MSVDRSWFLGRGEAHGYLLDPKVSGVDQTRQRVRQLWATGAHLFMFNDCLLLTLAEPVSQRAELGPGLPVRAHGRQVAFPRGGDLVVVDTDSLPSVDLSTLVDLDALAFDVAVPAPTVPPPKVPPPTPQETAPKPDLRRQTGIGEPTGALARGLRDLQRAGAGRATSSARTRGQGSAGYAGTAPKRRPLAQWLLRTPAGGLIGRRHARYVNKLTETFQRRDWQTALRSAISLGGGQGALMLRLPRTRGLVKGPSHVPPNRSGSVPYGPTLQAHLSQIYNTAAQRLEAEGQLMLAAFVHADLLGNPVAGVEMLERHAQHTDAASLAEGWNLDPALVVRLWWRAGDRDRAVRLGRARGAFAAAVQALSRIDTDATRELRRAWMLERRDAGDHQGAVEAAWPDPELRTEALPDIAAGIARGGTMSGTLMAHLLHLSTASTAHDAARALLTSEEPDLRPAKHAFLRKFHELSAADRTLDRELASLGVLASFDHSLFRSPHEALETRRALRPRADPLLVADLPRGLATMQTAPSEPLQLALTEPGQIPLFDAVAVGPDSVLLAFGELGVRLLDHRGKVRARWDTPTHRIIVADNGNRVLLVAARGGTHSLHRLDLPMSKPRPLPPINATGLLDAYDGARPIAITARGLQWLEQNGDRWRVSWTELGNPPTKIQQVSRTPQSMAVIHGATELNAWRWELPSLALRGRATVMPSPQMCILANGTIGRLDPQGNTAVLTWHTLWGQPLSDPIPVDGQALELIPLGDGYALVTHHDETRTVQVHPGVGTQALAHIITPQQGDLSLRVFDGLLTVGHASGQALVIDIPRHQVLADLRTSL